MDADRDHRYPCVGQRRRGAPATAPPRGARRDGSGPPGGVEYATAGGAARGPQESANCGTAVAFSGPTARPAVRFTRMERTRDRSQGQLRRAPRGRPHGNTHLPVYCVTGSSQTGDAPPSPTPKRHSLRHGAPAVPR